MSGGFRPNDQMRLPGIGVPVDPLTGFPLTPVILQRIQRYKEAEQVFRILLHELDGSSEGTRPGDARMARAFIKFDEMTHWVVDALLHHGDS